MLRPGFALGPEDWIHVVAIERLLFFHVVSRYLQANSSLQEDRELKKE